MQWSVVTTRTSDGHVVSVKLYANRHWAIQHTVHIVHSESQNKEVMISDLENYGESVDGETRISVVEISQ